MTGTLAWHFTEHPDKLRDGSPRVAGVTERYDGHLELGKRGLHASIRALDASRSAADWPFVSLVRCDGDVLRGEDKLVCSRRTPLWTVDATETLRWTARESARSVLALWVTTVPEAVQVWLAEEDLSDTARRAAWGAAETVARSEAWGTAWHAARSAVWSAAWSTTESAAWCAAASAADSTSWGATTKAAWTASFEEKNQILESLLLELANTSDY